MCSLPTIPAGCRCASRRAPCCVPPPFRLGEAAPTRGSTSCARCARPPPIRNRWRSPWRGGSSPDAGCDELRGLRTAAADQKSLAFGMAGLVPAEMMNAHRREASRLASELVQILGSIDDPTLTITLSYAAFIAKHETAEFRDILRLAQQVIDLADGDPTRGNMVFGSPLAFAIAMRGVARCCLGIGDWQADHYRAIDMVGRFGHPVDRATVAYYSYATAIIDGALLPDETALRITAEDLTIAEQYGRTAFDIARSARGFTLVHRDGPERQAGFDLLAQIRERAASGQY